MSVQASLADARKIQGEAKGRYMAAKADYGKWCDLVRDFEGLARQAQDDINSYIDQIQIVAVATPALDEDLNILLDEMAQDLLASHGKAGENSGDRT